MAKKYLSMALEIKLEIGFYVEDHVDALIQISEKGEVGNTYNIGGNQECSNIEIINLIQDIFSKKSKKVSHKIKYVKDRQHMTSDILLIVIKQKKF